MFLSIILTVLLTKMRLSSGQPVNLIDPTMTVSMKSWMNISGSFVLTNLNDGDTTSSFI